MRLSAFLLITTGLMTGTAYADSGYYKTSIYKKVYENASNIQQNASDIDNLDSRVTTNTNSIQDLATQIQNLPTGGGTGGTNNDAQVQANTTAINSLTTQVQTNTTNIGANTVLIQSNSSTIGSLSPQVQANTAAINSLTVDLNALQASLTALTTEVNTVKADLTGTQNSVNSLTTQVQSNTAAIVSNTSRIDALEASSGGSTGGGGGTLPLPDITIDFTGYVPTVTTKEFAVSNGGACSILRQDVSKTATATGTNVGITETLTSAGGVDCSSYQYNFVQTTTNLSLVGFSNLSTGVNANLDSPGVVMTNSMSFGKVFGYASTNTLNPTQAVIQTSTMIGVEPVTVPFGSYSNCVKLHSRISSSVIPSAEQVSWHCLGVGEVKRIIMDTSSNSMNVYTLTSAI